MSNAHKKIYVSKQKAKSNNFLWISFAEFFYEPNGSKDYIEISKNYEWIFINDFINCSDDSADILRRFISFIDICYRDKTKIKFNYQKSKKNRAVTRDYGFYLEQMEQIKDKTILLIDDIVTTGGTLKEAIKILQEGKPKKTHIICIASGSD